MDIFFIVILVLIACIGLWLNTLAVLCLFLDPELELVQRWGQLIIVLLVPYIGASFILKLINDHSPEVVSRFYIPWPFKHMVEDKSQRTCNDAANWVDTPNQSGNSFRGGGPSDGGSGE